MNCVRTFGFRPSSSGTSSLSRSVISFRVRHGSGCSSSDITSLSFSSCRNSFVFQTNTFVVISSSTTRFRLVFVRISWLNTKRWRIEKNAHSERPDSQTKKTMRTSYVRRFMVWVFCTRTNRRRNACCNKHESSAEEKKIANTETELIKSSYRLV